MDNDKTEAVQNVIDRVTSYQDGAPESTVEQELRTGLSEAGIDLEDSQVTALASAIEKNPGEVQAADFLQ